MLSHCKTMFESVTPRVGRRLRRFAHRHWPTILTAAIMTGLTVNVWVQDGTGVLLLIGGVSIGCTAVVFTCAGTSGYLVVKHSEQTQRAIESGKQRELTQ
jgi:hypothetical protein